MLSLIIDQFNNKYKEFKKNLCIFLRKKSFNLIYDLGIFMNDNI